jgi:uncharacterized membrane protein YraQ (UPF0718 family)
MEEIIGKIVLCLVIALLLGFLIGWLFSKALSKKEEHIEVDTVADLDNKLNVDLAEMEVKYEKEKALSAEYAAKNRELKGELMKKISLLESTSSTLKNLQTDTMSQQSKGNNFSVEKIAELENELAKKTKELAEFETVLVKAEETIEELTKKS